jgi:RimJ/RimL family protein N-acetyltransferase
MSMETEHLLLLPYSPADLLALIDGVAQFEQRFGLRVAPSLRGFIISDEVSPAWLEQLRGATAADPWVHGFAVVLRETNTVIGSAAFVGAPADDASVEIAYGIVPEYEGRGYATEAATALVAFALESGRVSLVRAHTRPTSNASQRVLAKCGFEHVGAVEHAEDGLVWRYERVLAPKKLLWETIR